MKNFFLIATAWTFFFCCCLNVQAAGRETIYLQTDRTAYIAGEPVYFKMYVLDAATKKTSDLSKVAYVELRAPRSNPSLKVRVKVDGGKACGDMVLPDTLVSGVYQLVAFTSAMKNYGEQGFFYNEIVVVNRFDKKLDFKLLKPIQEDTVHRLSVDTLSWIRTDKQIYGTREKVIVSLGQMNSNANIAVSVFEEPKVPSNGKSIVDFLNGVTITSEGRSVSSVFLPENRSKIIRGMVIDSISRKKIQDATVLLSCPDSVPNLQYAQTDSRGLFQMLLGDYYDGKDLFFTIRNVPAGKTWKIEIQDNFILSEKWKPELFDGGQSKEYINKSQDIVYINKSYDFQKGLIKEIQPESRVFSPQLYHCPVTSVYPSDFVPLNDFAEIAVEILPRVKIVKREGHFHARIVTSPEDLYGDNEPAIFLDGVYVDDIGKIIGMGSDRIKGIDVIENVRVFGDQFFYGVISIFSKNEEVLSSVPASNSVRLKNDRTATCKDFTFVNPKSADYEHYPFFRQLLYWNPNIETVKGKPSSFEFYTSDNTAKFLIKAEGITEDGTPVSACSSIQVQP